MAARKKKDNMYMGNPNVPSRGAEFEYTEEMLSEIAKCKNDMLYFAEKYFTIQIVGKRKELIKLHPCQKRVLKKMNEYSYFCYVASRQTGKSTLMTIYLLWLAIFFGDQRILLVANKEATAIEIFGRIRTAYELLPNWLKSPVDGEYGKTSMKLENDSRISISTTTGTAARGQSVSCLVIDEAAFIETHLMDPFWASVFPIVTASEDSKVFMCSTPNGTGNLFHHIYQGAVDGKNNWGHDKVLWNEVPGRTEEWAKKIRSGLASEEKWQQEYECCGPDTVIKVENLGNITIKQLFDSFL